MPMKKVQPKNILRTLKSKKLKHISNIKLVYNSRHWNKKEIKGPSFEMQKLLKLLDDHHYVSRYKVCSYGKTLRYIDFGLILIP